MHDSHAILTTLVLVSGCMNKMLYTYILLIRRKKLPFKTIWINTECIKLNDIQDRITNIN